MRCPPVVLFLVNKDTTILNFRLSLLVALRAAGYRVVVALPPGERISEIAAVGADILLTPMKKDCITPLGDMRLWRRYRRILRDVSPDVILTYTVKPTLAGGMAADGRVPLIATVTGRGRALGGSAPVRVLSTGLYRRALRNAAAVCFQNEADEAFFQNHRIAVGRHYILPGSGVDLDHFTPMPYPGDEGGPAFAFISRLLPEKGTDLYVEVARRVRARHPQAVFHVAGFGDAATEARMEALAREGVIVYHGKLRDIRPLLGEVHAVIHPTSYPEGLSNILLEAAASGRPVITTDRAGCREAVATAIHPNGIPPDGFRAEKISGYLVPERDADALTAAVERFLSLSTAERAAMGAAGRRRMEVLFDRRAVVERYMRLIQDVSPAPHPDRMSPLRTNLPLSP